MDDTTRDDTTRDSTVSTAGGRADGSTSDGATSDAVSELERQLGVLMRRARAASATVATTVHPDLDPAAYGLLVRLSEVGAERMTDLAGFLGVGKPTVSRQLSALVDMGMVERVVDPSDARAALVRLTAEGQTKFSRARAARREHFRGLLVGWPEEDVRELARLLGRLNDT